MRHCIRVVAVLTSSFSLGSVDEGEISEVAVDGAPMSLGEVIGIALGADDVGNGVRPHIAGINPIAYL